MFYGLNNFIKKILPKRLFYRSLVIVATPIILLQIMSEKWQYSNCKKNKKKNIY